MVISEVKEAVKVAGGLSLRIYNGYWVIIPQAHEWIEPRDSSEIVVDEKFVTKMAEFTDWSDGQKSDTRPKGEDETAGGHALFFVIHVAYKALHDIWLSR